MAQRSALDKQAELVTHLSGLRCSQVSLGMADALIIDFGELVASVDGQLTGSHVLVVECPWRIDGLDLPIVGWEDEEEEVANLATVLIGSEVAEVDVRRPGFDLTVQFSNDHRLRVFPDCRAYYSDEMSGGALPWQIAERGMPEPVAG